MAEQSQAERTESIEQRLEAVLASLSDAGAPAHRPSKPIALTLRLDSARYARLNAYAARYTPRRSFQAILVEALDAYLGEQGMHRQVCCYDQIPHAQKSEWHANVSERRGNPTQRSNNR